MRIINKEICLDTAGNDDLVNITEYIADFLKSSKLAIGSVTVFVVGSTAAISTFEYEHGLIEDIKRLYEHLVPSNVTYNHDEAWGDSNGHSHLRAALQGPSLTIPFEDGNLLLGTWQQVVLAEFDLRPRKRRVIVQIIGE